MSPNAPDLPTTIIPPKYAFLQNLQIGVNIILLVIWIAGALIYSLTVGRRRGPILLLATYVGLAVTNATNKLSVSSLTSLFALRENEFFGIFVFLLTSVLAFVALVRIIRSHTTRSMTRQGLAVLGALEMGAFLSSLCSFLPEEMQNQIAGFAGVLFLTTWTQVLWLLLPLTIFLIGEHHQRRNILNES